MAVDFCLKICTTYDEINISVMYKIDVSQAQNDIFRILWPRCQLICR